MWWADSVLEAIMLLEDLIAEITNPGEGGIRAGVYDDIRGMFNQQTEIADSAQAKIAELEASNATLLAQIAELKAHNYDLLMAVQGSTEEPTDSSNEESEETDDTDSLFEDDEN